MGKVLGVIPARLDSTRLARKMLADIHGKPLIYYTWRQAKKSTALDEVVVATDSKEIRDVVEEFGGVVVMTEKKIKTGSDRVAQASNRFDGFRPDIVVNIQGDEPMMPPQAITKTATLLKEDRTAVMSTVATRIANAAELADPGIVKVVRDLSGNALYFSRSVIPYSRTQYKRYLKHLGIYGYCASFLETYVGLKQTGLEKAESLEQLRALENGYSIKVGVGVYNRVEVNTRAELETARRMIQK